MLMSKSRLEKFLYALYSLDSSDLPNPLSRIEELYKCWVTGEEAPTFKPLSRVEKYLMAILGVYDVDSLPNPLSRVEVLLYKLATGDDNLDDVKSFLSEHEELLAEIIRNGGAGGNIDIEYVLYTLSAEHNTLYNTAEKPVKSAILKGNTKYRDIDTGDILDTFDETKNLELVSVKMPVLTTTGKNLFNINNIIVDGYIISSGALVYETGDNRNATDYIEVKPNCTYRISGIKNSAINGGRTHQYVGMYNENKTFISAKTIYCLGDSESITTTEDTKYIRLSVRNADIDRLQIEESSSGTEYEPHKSNILTTNEEVELRKVGDVQDELNLLTGEVTVRIGEIVLDGSDDEKWGYTSDYNIFVFEDLIYTDNYLSTHNLNKVTWNGFYRFNLRPSTYGITSTSEGREYLSNHPITLQYKLESESVKTVDLSVVDQDGNNTKLHTFNDITHVRLSSEGLIPEAELEVATKNEEVLNTLSLEMDDISTTQNALQETSNDQSENIDSTMLATTEIYEQLL